MVLFRFLHPGSFPEFLLQGLLIVDPDLEDIISPLLPKLPLVFVIATEDTLGGHGTNAS